MSRTYDTRETQLARELQDKIREINDELQPLTLQANRMKAERLAPIQIQWDELKRKYSAIEAEIDAEFEPKIEPLRKKKKAIYKEYELKRMDLCNERLLERMHSHVGGIVVRWVKCGDGVFRQQKGRFQVEAFDWEEGINDGYTNASLRTGDYVLRSVLKDGKRGKRVVTFPNRQIWLAEGVDPNQKEQQQ